MKFRCYLPAIWSLAVLAIVENGCSRTDNDDQASTAPKEVHTDAGVVLDNATQEKLGVEIGQPTAATWNAGLNANGRVLDPLSLADSLADIERSQLAYTLSRQEFERAKHLKEQNNISIRTYQETENSYMQNTADMATARRKMESIWGRRLAALAVEASSASDDDSTNNSIFSQLTNSIALVRIDLPIGTRWSTAMRRVRINSLADDKTVWVGTNFDQLPLIDPQTQQQGILVTVDQSATNHLQPGESVTAQLETTNVVSGVAVPANAVIRYEGLGWVYVQTETNRFFRIEVPTDQEQESGYFVDNHLSVTNRIIIQGAQAVLSAEMGGGFTTGERD